MIMRRVPQTTLKKQGGGWIALLLGCFLAGGLPHAASQATEHVIVIEAMQFSPATIEVKIGETITWKNKDPFPHTVTSKDGQFDSGEIKNNRSWKLKARTKGTYPYVCTLHPNMNAVFEVK
jgi:plastocyanin